MVFFVNRSSCGVRLAILCGIHKLGLLLSHWGSSWVFNGMGFPPRSYGTYYIVSLRFFLGLHLSISFNFFCSYCMAFVLACIILLWTDINSIVDWHLVIKWTRLGNLGWNDLWRDSSPNLDIGHYHHSMRLGKRGRAYGIQIITYFSLIGLLYLRIQNWSLYFCVGLILQAEKATMHMLRWADKK